MDLPEGDGGPLVVVGQFGSLDSNTVKKIVDKEVHDVHGLLADSDFGVDLLQNLVDVEREGLDSSFGPSDNGDSSSSGGFGRLSAGHWSGCY